MPIDADPLEVTLHGLWQHQQVPRSLLRTCDGENIEVVNPGRYNRDAGPDFQRATLSFNGKIVQGDVELHLDAADWQAHGHHLDPAYNQVILHIAIQERSPSPHENSIVCENGLPVRQLLLPNALMADASAQEQETLLACPLSQTTPTKILMTVRHAGFLRLEAKAGAFGEQLSISSWDQAMYRGIAEAIGYEKNQEPFRQLAETVPIDLLFSELRAVRGMSPDLLLEALLFGASGFLSTWPGPAQPVEAESAAFVSERSAIWEQLRHTLQIRPLRREAWQFFRLRPQNFPTRRLAGLSALILKFHRTGILEHFLTLVQTLGSKPKALVNEMVSHLICPAEGFWSSHYGFTGRPASPRPQLGDLIGRERVLDILTNVVLPALWLYFREAGNAALQNQVQEAYSNFPKLQENHLTRAMRRQLSQHHPVSRSVAKTAREQQGLIHLQKLYCRPLRCEECLKLVEESVAA